MAEITRSHRLGALLFIGSTLIGAGLLYVALAAARVGHGTYVPAMMAFPFATLSAAAFEGSIPPLVILAIVQFPLYGLILWIGLIRKRLGIVATTLIVLHVLAAVGGYLLVPATFR